MNAKKCKGNKRDGSPCDATALGGSNFCFFHDPSKAAERRAAQSLGGRGNRMKTLDRRVPDVNLEGSQDVVALLSETINQVRTGIIDPRVANAVGFLANIALRAVDQKETETRIARLETLFDNRTAAVNGR